MPMLEWDPEKRITAQEMLKHPWLNNATNFDYKMTELEFRKMDLMKKIQGDERSLSRSSNVSELKESDAEVNGGDLEDNLPSTKANSKEVYVSESDDSVQSSEDDGLELNTSFNGGYVPNTDLSRIDRGPNPQFKGIHTPA
jgi:serine/threonine protein kinase